jgi:hypothetical protein
MDAQVKCSLEATYEGFAASVKKSRYDNVLAKLRSGPQDANWRHQLEEAERAVGRDA